MVASWLRADDEHTHAKRCVVFLKIASRQDSSLTIASQSQMHLRTSPQPHASNNQQKRRLPNLNNPQSPHDTLSSSIPKLRQPATTKFHQHKHKHPPPPPSPRSQTHLLHNPHRIHPPNLPSRSNKNLLLPLPLLRSQPNSRHLNLSHNKTPWRRFETWANAQPTQLRNLRLRYERHEERSDEAGNVNDYGHTSSLLVALA